MIFNKREETDPDFHQDDGRKQHDGSRFAAARSNNISSTYFSSSERSESRRSSIQGFTLVELLVVISVLIILAGVTLSILNPKKQRQKAEDSIRVSNLEKVATALESYGNANGTYPLDSGADGIPDGAEVAVFISSWPNGEPTASAVYTYVSDGTTFGTYVPKSTDSSACFKYRSSWGKIKECTVCDGGTDGCL